MSDWPEPARAGTSFKNWESGFSLWLCDQLRRLELSKLLYQCILATFSSLLTELGSSAAAASVLVPVAVDIAAATHCNPLYYAIPVTVAASTSFLLPTSGIGLAILSSIFDIGPLELLLPALKMKLAALTMIVLAVNLNPDLRRLPEWVFVEDDNGTATLLQ
ncbi:solute carrier family 13 member 1-like [Haemaphysalis longicornis]